jgi:hypothetical protein
MIALGSCRSAFVMASLRRLCVTITVVFSCDIHVTPGSNVFARGSLAFQLALPRLLLATLFRLIEHWVAGSVPRAVASVALGVGYLRGPRPLPLAVLIFN